MSDEEKKVFQQSLIESYLEIDLSKLDEDERFFINTILKVTIQSIDLKKIEEIVDRENDKREEEEENERKQILEESKMEDENMAPMDKLDYCLPYCSSTYSAWIYTISSDWYMDAKLSEEELSRFTSVWLKNYIKFYHTMHSLWLGFLWWKYKSSFVTLLNNKVWFSYPDWAWVTESRFLRVLNLLWKSMWIIWKIDDDNYIKPYDTLEWALKAFRDFKWSGKVKDKVLIENLVDEDKFEVLLKSRWYIDPKWDWLVFFKFNQL